MVVFSEFAEYFCSMLYVIQPKLHIIKNIQIITKDQMQKGVKVMPHFPVETHWIGQACLPVGRDVRENLIAETSACPLTKRIP
jgi:hypothetical protein